MSVTVGYTGYFDRKRNYRINYENRELVFTVSRGDRKQMKELGLDFIEKKIKYPTSTQIRESCIMFSITNTDGSEEESVKPVQTYPLTICNFLMNKRLKTDEIQNYMDRYCVSVTHEHQLHNLAHLKYYETDRVVKITALSQFSPSIQIFSFMQKHIRKYVVNHVKWNANAQKWSLLSRLADGKPLVPPGGAMSVSKNEIDLLCKKQQLPITEYLYYQNYVLKQEKQVLQKYYEDNAEKWLDFMEQLIWTYLDNSRYWNKWNDETIFMSKKNKNTELNKVIKKYDVDTQWEYKNKAKTQETMSIAMDDLQALFGDEIQKHYKQSAEKFMVTATEMKLTYYLKKPTKKNLKIAIYVSKTRLKQTK